MWPRSSEQLGEARDRGGPMRYLMFVCADPEAEHYVPEEDNINEWVDEMDRRNVRILGHRLKDVEDATTVRRRKGQVLITDGPFTETKEWITGADVLKCAAMTSPSSARPFAARRGLLPRLPRQPCHPGS